MKPAQSGFTLVELMIAAAIVGILAAIAIPSYQESVRKARRADVMAALLGFANRMERLYTETNSYCGALDGAACDGVDTSAPVATVFHSRTPSSALDGDQYYNLTLSADAATDTYTLIATPDNNQADDRCGVLSLTNTGVRRAIKDNNNVAECW